MSENGKNRREKAAAARTQAESAEKRRERTIRIVGAVTVVAVVVGIIGVAVIARGTSSETATGDPTSAANPSAAVPAGALPATDPLAFGVLPYGAKEGVPVLAIWEDFQCPACKAVEEANGEGIRKLGESGAVQVVWRPTAFLDANLGNDSSSRAIAAFGCAVDAGKAADFHDVVFANQPEKEGEGYTDEQLLQFGTDIGITGADFTKYTSCYESRTYLPWAANSTTAFYGASVPGTPYATLNGVEVPTEVLADPAALEKAISDAAAGAAPAASPAS